MARDVESLALSLQALLSEDMYRLDPTMPQMPFREEVTHILSPVCFLPLRDASCFGLLAIWSHSLTPKKLWEQHTAVEEYQQEFIAKWRSLDLDVLLVPVLGSAFYIGSSSLASESQFYVTLYNLLDFPAGVVPVTIVTLQDEEELAFYKGCYGDSSDKNFSEVYPPNVCHPEEPLEGPRLRVLAVGLCSSWKPPI
ncbi:fatty-acid amide hydrolase 1-like [Symphalangus syndactylus]|uniref:fatty-acid amide hydrolase 1-like n=1 Tax=Symphalangus syndactylus TaxID=9590 RepID=UPI003007EE01